jgi:hypothetical protein
MARGSRVEVVGRARLVRTLRQAGHDVEDLKDAHQAVAAVVAAAAAATAPRRTGKLAASVRGNRAVGRAVVRAGRASVPYAGPVHWGWPSRNIAAQPFVAEAAQVTEPVWLALYENGVVKALDRVKGA